MNILLNCDSLLILGGAENHITELALQLVKYQHKVYLASWAFHPAKQEELKNAGVVLINKSEQKIDAYLQKIKLDVIHGHQFDSMIQAFNLAKIYNTKFGFTIHGMYDFYIDRSPIGYEVAKTINFLITVDYSVREYISYTPVAADKIHVVPNGVDLNKFKFNQFKDNSGKIITYISRYDDGKQNVALKFMDAIAHLSRSIPGISCFLAGGGSHYEIVENKAREINNKLGRDVIRILGWSNNIPELMEKSSIIIGSERVAIEGMAAGRPVLLFSISGYGGLIRRANFKKLVLRRDQQSKDFIEAVSRDIIQLQERDFWMTVSKESRQIAEEYFNLDRICQQIENIYSQ